MICGLCLVVKLVLKGKKLEHPVNGVFFIITKSPEQYDDWNTAEDFSDNEGYPGCFVVSDVLLFYNNKAIENFFRECVLFI